MALQFDVDTPEGWVEYQKLYDILYEAQEGKCLVCGHEDTSDGTAKTDYKYSIDVYVPDRGPATDKVLGLLCYMCMEGLNFFNENPDLLYRAATLLQSEGTEEWKTRTRLSRR